MAYELRMGDDGILRLVGTGDLDEEIAEAVMKDLASFLEAATMERPLLLLSDVSRSGKVSSRARSLLADLARDPRLGKNAILGGGRYNRVLASFINKATGQDNIRFFDSEEEALVWLKNEG